MAPHAIISYDDTQNDHDALMLGRMFQEVGARLTLAYVRHTAQLRRDREQLEVHEAEALLDRGARLLGESYTERRVVLSASTAEGLGWLATEEEADLIVFGAEYRTGAGHVSLCRSAQTLLERGPAALAIAPAGYQDTSEQRIDTIGVLPGSADEAAIETAFSLAARFDAEVVDRERGVDLLVVGSRAEAPQGRVMISARSQNAIEEATSPVIVAARGVALHFETLVTA
ncbi:MAG TPA: universal stress protein [Solirubrobacteraceae bacterium]|jgi:nucleotide-binding universal stress UspA family protein